jgi:hypothetical protein
VPDYSHTFSLGVSTSNAGASINTAGENWLKICKLAKKDGMLDTAYAAALNADKLGNSAAAIQIAKIYWMKGQQSEALRVLSEGIRNPHIHQAWTSRQRAKVG